MRYLHSMVRVKNLEKSLHFYCNLLGLIETRRSDYEKGRFSLIFLSAPADFDHAKNNKAPLLELTYNWDEETYESGRNFGHLAYEVDNIYEITAKLQTAGVEINRPPRDGRMTFIKSPDGISIELLQKGEALPPQEPWLSMPSVGTW